MAASIDHNATDICAIADRWNEFIDVDSPVGCGDACPR